MYALSPSTLSFIINSIQQTLPDPRNLKRWKIMTEAVCSLCNWKNVTHIHILCSCKVALEEGRISFRHDSILKVLHDALEVKIEDVKNGGKVPVVAGIQFVKAGKRMSKDLAKKKGGLIDAANDWTISVDYRSAQAQFPAEIWVTKERPDIVLYSNVMKIVIMLELTAPAEENIAEWKVKKKQKYEKLATQIRDGTTWTPHVFTIEVGARGFVASSVQSVLCRLGIKDNQLINHMSRTSIRASHFIWINRDNPNWKRPSTC